MRTSPHFLQLDLCDNLDAVMLMWDVTLFNEVVWK